MNNFGLGGSRNAIFGFPERSQWALTGAGMYECLSPKNDFVIQGQKFKVDVTLYPRMGSIWIHFMWPGNNFCMMGS